MNDRGSPAKAEGRQRFEERRLNVVRTTVLVTALAIGAAIVIDALIAVHEFTSLFDSSP